MSRKAGAIPSSSEHKAGTHPGQNALPSQETLHTHTQSDWDYVDTPINLTCKTGKWEDIEYLEKAQADMGEHTNSTQTWPKLGIDFFFLINITSKWY